jgi:hypothetical protein
VADETDKWAKVISAANIKAECPLRPVRVMSVYQSMSAMAAAFFESSHGAPHDAGPQAAVNGGGP